LKKQKEKNRGNFKKGDRRRRKLQEENRLRSEDLKNVSGGCLHQRADYAANCPVYQVIEDKTGEVPAEYYDDLDRACDHAVSIGMRTGLLTDQELEELRKTGKINWY
jgi:hypothetical protein